MSNYISQAFSLKLLKLLDYNAIVKVTKIDYTEIPRHCISAIGHDANVIIINKLLNSSYKKNRDSISLRETDTLYIVMTKTTIDAVDAKRISVKNLKNKVICLKVTIKVFEVESNLKRIKRLIRTANQFFTHHFSFQLLRKIKDNAELKVTKINKDQIPKNGLITYIENEGQKEFLEDELKMNINHIYKRWSAQDGDIFYIATTDDGRAPDTGRSKDENTKEYFSQHSIFLKVEVSGMSVQMIEEN